MATTNQLTCKDFVEFLTDYLEGALPAAERARFEAHLADCPGCQTYLEQMRQTIRAVSRLSEEAIPSEGREKLLAVFRSYAQAKAAPPRTLPLGIGEETAAPGDHIAYFWETEQDFAAALGFLEAGLAGKDFCVIFGHREANEKVTRLLRSRGYDLTRLTAERRLSVVGGAPTVGAMLTELAGIFQAALAGGAPLIRLLGNLGWGRESWPGDDGILEFEAQVTEAARQFPCVIVCLYDVRTLPGRLILKGGFETHPLTFHSFALHQNPHYVPTDVFLRRLQAGAGSGRVH